MNESHPEREQLERFLLGKTSADENRVIVRHLLKGCPECRKLPREILTLEKHR